MAWGCCRRRLPLAKPLARDSDDSWRLLVACLGGFARFFKKIEIISN
jgi:hypothetical protein